MVASARTFVAGMYLETKSRFFSNGSERGEERSLSCFFCLSARESWKHIRDEIVTS